jgi:hypothetical protein
MPNLDQREQVVIESTLLTWTDPVPGSQMSAKWCAIQYKIANSYMIEIII